MKPLSIAILALSVAGLLTSTAHAQFLALQNATATFSQPDNDIFFSPSWSIDGNAGGHNGWAIFDGDYFGGTTSAQTAVFETGKDVGTADGSIVEFKLYFNYAEYPSHQLGRFRLSATTDSRTTFADGLATGGDVTASWTVLEVTSLQSLNGTGLSLNLDGSILASNQNPTLDTYTIRTKTGLVGITGFRLEAMEDPSLPTSGPGMVPCCGNFVLSEFSVSLTAIPEPEKHAATFCVALLGTGIWLRRKKTQGQ
jgi:hypothetical protein